MNKPIPFMMHSEVREYINGDKSYVIVISIEGKQHYSALEYELAMNPETVLQATKQMLEVVFEGLKKE